MNDSKIACIQNVSSYSGSVPTIKIVNGSPEWEESYKNWLLQKNPTESPEWKTGVFLVYKGN